MEGGKWGANRIKNSFEKALTIVIFSQNLILQNVIIP
jgi:hypothetical protein